MPTRMKLELQSSHRVPRLPHNLDLMAVAVLVLAVAAAPAATPKAIIAIHHQPAARVPQPSLQKMCR